MVRLSKRLQAVADFVPPGCRPVDVGTDHAYLPIYLVQVGKADEALAADVREGPLERAKAHIARAGLEDHVHTRLSDGLSAISPQDGDVLILAGMGGMLTIRILRGGDISGFRMLVLAPQSDLASLREALREMNLRIAKETLVQEDGKYYPVLCVVHGPDADMDPVRMQYGKQLVPQARETMLRYLRTERENLLAAISQITSNAAGHEAAGERLKTLQMQLRLNEEAQRRVRQENAWNEASEFR